MHLDTGFFTRSGPCCRKWCSTMQPTTSPVAGSTAHTRRGSPRARAWASRASYLVRSPSRGRAFASCCCGCGKWLDVEGLNCRVSSIPQPHGALELNIASQTHSAAVETQWEACSSSTDCVSAPMHSRARVAQGSSWGSSRCTWAASGAWWCRRSWARRPAPPPSSAPSSARCAASQSDPDPDRDLRLKCNCAAAESTATGKEVPSVQVVLQQPNTYAIPLVVTGHT